MADRTRDEGAGIDPGAAGSARRAALWAGGFVLLLAAALPLVGLREVAAELGRLDAPLVLALLGLSLANYAVRALRWQALSRAAGVRAPLGRNVLYYVAGFAFAVTPGKVGEVVRLWLLRRNHGAPYARTLGMLAVDRVADAVSLVALCLPGAAGFAGQGPGFAAAAGVVLGGGALVLRPGWLVGPVKLAYGRVRRRPRLFAGLLRSLRSLRALASPRVLALSLALGIVGWAAEIVGAWLVLDRLGTGIGLPAAAFVFGFGMLVGGLPLFPGGVGGAEGTMVGLLLLLGVDVPTAVAATAIIRLATLGFALVLGFAALPLAIRRPLPAARPAGRPLSGATPAAAAAALPEPPRR